MKNDVETLLGKCVVQIRGNRGYAGGGFFVGPGTILTCAHVTTSLGEHPQVRWKGRTEPVRVVARLPDDSGSAGMYPAPDLAVLEISGSVSNECVWLDDAEPAGGSRLLVRGFSDDLVANEITEDAVRLEVVGQVGGDLVKVRDGRISDGLSGGPVLDLDTGRVCGVLKRSKDFGRSEGGWIISGATIAAELPDLVQANRRLHASRNPWHELAGASTRRSRRVAASIGVSGTVILLALGVGVHHHLGGEAAPPMSGDLNLVVAPINSEAGSGNAKATARGLSESLFEGLRSRS